MDAEKIRVVAFDLDDMAALRAIERRLFGDGSTLHPDQRRDLANRMHVILGRGIAIELPAS